MDGREQFEAYATEIAERANVMIASCHERVPCPKCGKPIGERCVRAEYTRGGRPGSKPPLKHPHRERWSQEVPPR